MYIIYLVKMSSTFQAMEISPCGKIVDGSYLTCVPGCLLKPIPPITPGGQRATMQNLWKLYGVVPWSETRS